MVSAMAAPFLTARAARQRLEHAFMAQLKRPLNVLQAQAVEMVHPSSRGAKEVAKISRSSTPPREWLPCGHRQRPHCLQDRPRPFYTKHAGSFSGRSSREIVDVAC